jgi:hypothetical protein
MVLTHLDGNVHPRLGFLRLWQYASRPRNYHSSQWLRVIPKIFSRLDRDMTTWFACEECNLPRHLCSCREGRHGTA